MQNEMRAPLMGALWFFSALALVALFISSAAMGDLTSAHMVLAFVILALAVSGTLFLSRLSVSDAQGEKSKRQRVESLLRDLSDEDLNELKRRLETVDQTEKPLADYLGDDGELVQRG